MDTYLVRIGLTHRLSFFKAGKRSPERKSNCHGSLDATHPVQPKSRSSEVIFGQVTNASCTPSKPVPSLLYEISVTFGFVHGLFKNLEATTELKENKIRNMKVKLNISLDILEQLKRIVSRQW